MPRLQWKLAGLLFVAIGTQAGAQTRPGFELGLEGLDYDYRERFDGEEFVRNDGSFVGLTLAYVETLGGGWFLRARGDAATGEIDYRDSDGARAQDVEQGISRFELGIGRDIALGALTLTPSIAIGARLLRDESGGVVASDGSPGYDREISYVYVPVGLALGGSVGRGARVTLSGRYGWIIGGEVKSELSQADSALPDLRLDIDGGHMWEADLALSFPLGRRALSVGPFVRRWSADRSEGGTIPSPFGPVTFFELPARTTEAGLRVSFGF